MRQVLKQTLGLFHEDSTFYVVRQVNLNQSINDYAGCVDQVLVINGRIAVLQQEGIDVQNLGLETSGTLGCDGNSCCRCEKVPAAAAGFQVAKGMVLSSKLRKPWLLRWGNFVCHMAPKMS